MLKDGSLKTGESVQHTSVDRKCTELVLSSRKSAEVQLYAEGPCKDIGISVTSFIVNFIPCPTGLDEGEQTCICDSNLKS